MPSSAPNTKGLTKGKGKAFKALGVKLLEKDEASKTVRIRTPWSTRHLKLTFRIRAPANDNAPQPLIGFLSNAARACLS